MNSFDLALELLLVARDLLVGAAQLEARQVRVVQKDVVLAVDLLDDEVRDDVVVARIRIHQARLGIELLDLVGGLLNVGRTDAEALGDLTPAMVDELLEAVAHESERHRLFEPRLAKLQHEAFAKIARADARRIQVLDDPEHLLGFDERVQRQIVDVAFGRLGSALHFFVHAVENLLERTGEIAVFGDVADEFVGEELLARRQVEQRDLIDQVVGEIAAVDRDGLVVLALLVLFAATAGVETVEENLFPVDLVVGGLLFRRRFGRFGLGRLFLATPPRPPPSRPCRGTDC